mgnify:CR=1 FL=1
MRQKANRDAEVTGEADIIIHNTCAIVCYIAMKFLQCFESEMTGEESHLIQMIFNVMHELSQVPNSFFYDH